MHVLLINNKQEKIPYVWVGPEERCGEGEPPNLTVFPRSHWGLAAWPSVGTDPAVLLALAPVTTM